MDEHRIKRIKKTEENGKINRIENIENVYYVKGNEWDPLNDRYLQGLIFSHFGKGFGEMTHKERCLAINIVLCKYHHIYGIDSIGNIGRLFKKLKILEKTCLIDVCAGNGFLLGLLRYVDKKCNFTLIGYDIKIIEPRYFEFIYQQDFVNFPVYAFKKDTAIILSFPDIISKINPSENISYKIIKNAEENGIDCIILFGYKERPYIQNDWVIHPDSYRYLKKKWNKVLETHFFLGVKKFIEVYTRRT